MSLGRVLIVDDEPDLRKAVRLTLTKAGYDVVEAEDGEKGIAAVRSGDNPLLLGILIVTATLVCLFNLITDIAYSIADPRVELG